MRGVATDSRPISLLTVVSPVIWLLPELEVWRGAGLRDAPDATGATA